MRRLPSMKTQRAKWIVFTPGEVAAVEEVPRRVVEVEEDHDERPAPEAARLDVSDRRERVLDDVILERGEHLDAAPPPASRAAPHRASRGCAGPARRTAPAGAGAAGTEGSAAGRRRDAPSPSRARRARAAPPARAPSASFGSCPTISRTARRTSSGARPCQSGPASRIASIAVAQRRLLADLAHGATRSCSRTALPPSRRGGGGSRGGRARTARLPGSPRSVRRPGRCPRPAIRTSCSRWASAGDVEVAEQDQARRAAARPTGPCRRES